jgi:hypothetical protein
LLLLAADPRQKVVLTDVRTQGTEGCETLRDVVVAFSDEYARLHG